jgi:hypothetical protein
MSDMRKITAFVPADLLAAAQAYTDAGVSETLRAGLEKLAHEAFYQRMRALRGKLKFDDFDLAELREDRDADDAGGRLDRR